MEKQIQFLIKSKGIVKRWLSASSLNTKIVNDESWSKRSSCKVLALERGTAWKAKGSKGTDRRKRFINKKIAKSLRTAAGKKQVGQR